MKCDMVLAEVMSDRRTDAVEAHLAVCPRCRSMIDSAVSMGRHLRDPIIWEDPPDDLEGAVMAAVAGEKPTAATSRTTWWLGVGAAVLTVVVAVGVWFGSRPDWTIELVAGPDAGNATATVRGWNTDSGTRMVLHVDGVAAAPSDAFYEVWLSAPDGRRVSAGTFRSPGRIHATAAVSRAEFPRVWITKEPTEAGGTSYQTTVLDTPTG